MVDIEPPQAHETWFKAATTRFKKFIAKAINLSIQNFHGAVNNRTTPEVNRTRPMASTAPQKDTSSAIRDVVHAPIKFPQQQQQHQTTATTKHKAPTEPTTEPDKGKGKRRKGQAKQTLRVPIFSLGESVSGTMEVVTRQ